MESDVFYKNERLALFLDNYYIFSLTKSLGFTVDFKRFREVFASKGRLQRITVYSTILEKEEGVSPLKPLHDWLVFNGYQVVTKPAKTLTDEDGRRHNISNMYVEMATDMLTLSPRLDHVVLGAGGSDLSHPIQELKKRGVRVSLLATTRSDRPVATTAIRALVDDFIEIKDLQKQIQMYEQ